MQIRPMVLRAGFCLALLSAANQSQAQRPEWLNKLAASLPQFTVTASPISSQGTLSPDGRWLATDTIIDPGVNEPGATGTERFGVQILNRGGKVVGEITRGHNFYSVNRFVWGKESNTLYFENGTRMKPGTRDVPAGPVVWQAALGTRLEPIPCDRTTFAEMPYWSPRGDSYLMEQRDRSEVKYNGEGERLSVLLTSSKHKSRFLFHDAIMPAWSPNGSWIRLENYPATGPRNSYLRIADSRTGKERAYTAILSSFAENNRYGWKSATLDMNAPWLVDSVHLLMAIRGRYMDGTLIHGSFVVSSRDGSHVYVPDICPVSGSRDGRTILIATRDEKLFLVNLSPKRRNRE